MADLVKVYRFDDPNITTGWVALYENPVGRGTWSRPSNWDTTESFVEMASECFVAVSPHDLYVQTGDPFVLLARECYEGNHEGNLVWTADGTISAPEMTNTFNCPTCGRNRDPGSCWWCGR